MRVAIFVLALAACAPAASAIPTSARVVLSRSGDPRIGTYVSKPWGFETASYWIDGPEGLVMIDTQFLPSAAAESIRWAETTTKKKVVAAIVLHPNPDKFNGTKTFQSMGIRVLTSDSVLEKIPHVHEIRTRAFAARYAPDYPTELPKPESFGATTREIELAGLKLKLHVLGPGCSEAHVVVEWEKNVFVGDLVGSGTHAWLELGSIDEWLARLSEIQAMHPDYVHPGRGPSGGPELLEFEKTYLKSVEAIVDQAESVESAKTTIVQRWPLAYDVFLDVGLGAVWKARKH